MPDGTVKYLHVVGHAVRDPAEDLEFIGSVIDVTAAKHAEEELHKAQASLAHAARVMTLGELAASIAHEINQPLTAIASSGNACLRWLGRTPPDLDAARHAAARIVQDAHRAGDVMRGLRALAGKSGPQLMPFAIDGAIQEVLALTRTDLHRHGVELHTDLSAQVPPVIGDRVQLQQVLLNLVMNGIQAMATVSDRRRELAISISPAAPEHVQVTIEDTGQGSIRPSSNAFSIPSSPPSPTASAWGFRSPGRSSRPMAGNYGPPARAARHRFPLHASRRRRNLTSFLSPGLPERARRMPHMPRKKNLEKYAASLNPSKRRFLIRTGLSRAGGLGCDHTLGEALVAYYRSHTTSGIDGYSARALARVWKSERFSWCLPRSPTVSPAWMDFRGACRWRSWITS